MKELHSARTLLRHEKQTALSLAEKLCELGINNFQQHRLLPAANRRDKPCESFTLQERRRLQKLVDNASMAICNLILLVHGSDRYRSFRKEHSRDAMIKGAIVQGIKSTKKRSLERQTLCGVL